MLRVRFRAGWLAPLMLALLFGCPKKEMPSNSAPINSGIPRSTSSRDSASAPLHSGGSSASSPALHLTLGNPSGATADPGNLENYLIERPQYALAYRNTLGTPLWVSWHLSAQDQGNVDRGKFQPDKDLPEGFTRLTPRDYTGTGFDRGHMCPSADRTATEEDNDATFLMTNIVPQAPGNNQGPWKELEDYCRELTKQGNELYIVAGPGGSKRKLARGRLNVPQFTWKVAVVLPESDGDDLARINAQTRVIAVKMPNLSTIRSRPWQSFRTTVRDIEQETSLNLLTNLPPSVQNALKQKQDSE